MTDISKAVSKTPTDSTTSSSQQAAKQQEIRRLKTELNQAPPGSDEADMLLQRIAHLEAAEDLLTAYSQQGISEAAD